MKRFLQYDDYIYTKSSIAETREMIIRAGKRSPKFKPATKKHFKANPEKYTELDNIENAGSINQIDAEVLYSIIRYFKPKSIFECGTWIGTSAYFMAMALDDVYIEGRVYTCDNQDKYISTHPKIKYHNLSSRRLLKLLKKKGIKFDIAFYDGRFEDGDAKRISKGCKIFIAHDYKGKEKGYRNIKAMQKLWPNAELITPLEGSSIAVLWNK